jgi:DNA polymerase-1
MISTVDYSAAELRILADLSGDHLMIDGFNSGIDFHCYVASMIFGVEVTKTNENKKLREPTKTLNFGIAYGMSPFTLYEKLVYELGQKITLKECEELFKGYKRTFREAIHWLDSQQRLASSQFVMRNMNGRTRHWFRPNRKKIEATAMAELTKGGKLAMTEDMENMLPVLIDQKMQAHLKAVQREGANCQIQSVNADFTKNSMARIRKEFKKRKYDSRMYNSVYDEIVMDSHKNCAEEAHELQKKIMVEEANKMLKRVPMLVEGHLAPCWTK